tara:strand:- start:73 stop:393 length:321 start_codon:yes stop_codon:yes gene_type:complete
MATKAQLLEVIRDMDKAKEELEQEASGLAQENYRLCERATLHDKERQCYNVNDVKYMEGLEAKNYELGRSLQEAHMRLNEFTQGSLMKEVKKLEKYIIKHCLEGIK